MGVKTQQMVQYSCMFAVTLVSTASQCGHTLPRRAYLERDESAVCTGCMPADVCASTDANEPHSARAPRHESRWRCFKFVHDLMHARKYTGRTARTARWTRHKHRSITTTGDSKHKHRNQERCTEPQPGRLSRISVARLHVPQPPVPLRNLRYKHQPDV